MSNIEEFIEEKRQGRPYRDVDARDTQSHVRIGLDSFARSLLDGLAQQFSEDTSILAAEPFRAALIDVRLSQKRDMEAAKRFLQKALSTAGEPPKRVTTDGHDSYPRAIREP